MRNSPVAWSYWDRIVLLRNCRQGPGTLARSNTWLQPRPYLQLRVGQFCPNMTEQQVHDISVSYQQKGKYWSNAIIAHTSKMINAKAVSTPHLPDIFRSFPSPPSGLT